MIEIDGSLGEGGGQVLRTTLSLSAITGQAVRIINIRKKRKKKGLAAQHLTAVKALADICRAEISGADLGSMVLTFRPKESVQPGNYVFDVSRTPRGISAGSLSLVLQSILLPLALADGDSHVILKGGTHVQWSPPYDYIENVYLPMLARMGIKARCLLDNFGFYPKGGGQITLYISGIKTKSNAVVKKKPRLLALTVPERGPIKSIRGRAIAHNLPQHIAERMANTANQLLDEEGLYSEIIPAPTIGVGIGAGIFINVEYENVLAGFSALGERGKPSEKVAQEACHEFLMFHRSGAAIEPHLADQLLLPMALANGESSFETSRITQHLLTNAHIIQQMIPARIEISGMEGQPGKIIVKGIGETTE